MKLRPLTKKIVKWGTCIILLLLLISFLFPCTNCQGNSALKTETRFLIQNFDLASRAYKKEYCNYPSGRPNEIISALTGNNPRCIEFLSLGVHNLDQNGNLIDLWRTPFRFIQNTDSEPPQLISAGPDKIFETQDDLTLTNH